MIFKFTAQEVLIGLFLITTMIYLSVYFYKIYLNKLTNKLINKKTNSSLVRKYDEVNINNSYNLFYTGGITTALLISLLLINLTTSNKTSIDEKDISIEDILIDEVINIEKSKTKSLPPPIIQTVIKIDDKIIEKEPDTIKQNDNNQNLEGDKNGKKGGTGDSIITIIEPPIITKEPEIFSIVEEMPYFPGCEELSGDERKKCSDKKMVNFIGKKAYYTTMARESAFEGTVYIRFVVEKDGTISNIEVIKDNTEGGGLKESALKAVKSMNEMNEKWKPGKQRGNPVRVRIIVPVKFKLE
jgi:protein TonB